MHNYVGGYQDPCIYLPSSWGRVNLYHLNLEITAKIRICFALRVVLASPEHIMV